MMCTDLNLRSIALGIMTAMLCFSGTAQAQAIRGGVDFQLWNPVEDGQGLMMTHESHTLKQFQWHTGLYLQSAQNPAFLYGNDGGTDVEGVVERLTTANFVLAVGLFDWLDVFAHLPIVLGQEVRGSIFADDRAQHGLGNIQFGAKANLWRRTPGGVGVAIGSRVGLPTGEHLDFLGTREPTVDGFLVLDAEPVRGLVFALNTGYRYRAGDSVQLGDITIDDQIFYAVGASYESQAESDWLRWRFGTEVVGHTSAHDFFEDHRNSPVEIIFSARHQRESGFAFNVAPAIGLNDGIAAPEFRAIMGITYTTPESSKCLYGDGEDVDGFQDDDGCLDPDDDGDGILDAQDACPMLAEDMDGFRDADGCPDADNDRDGILDAEDACPLHAELFNGIEDADGCPEPDADGDGVARDDDRCPSVPEDIDGFEDEDGCPEFDNDMDGVADIDDGCPLDPEDIDGYEDDDGCPEAKSFSVILQDDQIQVPNQIYFLSGSPRIREDLSAETLDEIAEVLNSHAWIKQLQIEGHTDSRGSEAYNQTLSQQRAESVRAYLMGKGIDADRLRAVGFGESRPIRPNKTRAGRAANRRVDFIILEQGEHGRIWRYEEQPKPLTSDEPEESIAEEAKDLAAKKAKLRRQARQKRLKARARARRRARAERARDRAARAAAELEREANAADDE